MLRFTSKNFFLAKTCTRFAAAATATAAPSFGAARKGALGGEAIGKIDATSFSALPAAAISHLPQVDQYWLNIEGAHRQRLQKFIDGGKAKFDSTAVLAKRTAGIEAMVNSTELPKTSKIEPKLAAAIKTFIESGKKDVNALFDAYDTLSLLIKGLERDREVIQLDIWGYNDAIKLGLKFFSQDVLTEKKKGLAQAAKDLAHTKAVMKAACEAAFTTEVMNDILNILRMYFSDNKDVNARQLGVQILDDLSLFGVAFDGETELLFRNLVFGDLPHDDSGLLFELVEASVGGSIAVTKLPDTDVTKITPELNAVADDTLKVISKRFQTPLSDDLVKLRQVETHPLLQRSLE